MIYAGYKSISAEEAIAAVAFANLAILFARAETLRVIVPEYVKVPYHDSIDPRINPPKIGQFSSSSDDHDDEDDDDDL